jgi:hypothetical protein
MKVKVSVIGIFACAAMLASPACEKSGSTGGGGADFDSSLYYTKLEVDQKIAELAGQTSDAIDYATPTRGDNWTGGPSTMIDNTNDSYENGISLGNPSGANFVMLFIQGSCDDINGFDICGGASTETDPRCHNIPSDFEYTNESGFHVKGSVFLWHVHGSDTKFWVEGLGDSSANFYIDSVWFRERNN